MRYICVCVYIYVYVCIHTYMYICICIHMNIYIHTHIYLTITRLLPHIMLQPLSLTNCNFENKMLTIFYLTTKYSIQGMLFRKNLCDFSSLFQKMLQAGTMLCKDTVIKIKPINKTTYKI